MPASVRCLVAAPLHALDWFSARHADVPADADRLGATLAALLVIAAMAAATLLAAVAAGLIVGGLALFHLQRRRHLFWALPLVNAALYLALRPALPAESPGLAPLVALPTVLIGGWVAALVLVPLALLWQHLQPQPGAPAGGEVPAVVLRLPARTWPGGLHEGFMAPLEGLSYLNQHRHLWRYGIWPLVLNVCLTGLVLLLVLAAAAAFAVYLHPRFGSDTRGVLLEILAGILLLLAALGVALGVWVLLQAVLCAHFYERLARHVELELGLPPEALRDVPWHCQVQDGLRNLALILGVNLGFLVLHCVPVLGAVLALTGSIAFDCAVFGGEFLGLPMALRGLRRDEQRQVLRQHRPQVLGLGASVLLFNLIPLVGSVLVTTAVVGAVLLHRRLRPGSANEPHTERGMA